jgi:gliding motility-associatede transport system auxiliary component
MVDLAFPVEPGLAALLAQAGVQVGDGVVVDPLDHYFTDEQMVAITRYTTHAITRGLALSFYPGVRPLAALPAPGITVTPLFLSSAESYVQPLSGMTEKPAAAKVRGPQVLAIASEGVWPGAAHAQTFRLVVIGDADFASNSFFPYMSNSDMVLAMLAWLMGEERAPTMKPPIEVLPTVVLTRRQVYGIFAVTVLGLPGLVATLGGVISWRRRR